MKIISKFFNFKNNKETQNKILQTPKKEFNIDEFNNWFQTEFDGYDGRKGAPGIFLRLDKFTAFWVEDYLKYIGQNPSWEDVTNCYQIIRKDWLEKLQSY